MKVVLVHDWLTGMRGGERVLEAFLALYPQADIATLLHVPGSVSPQIEARIKHLSPLQNIPYAQRNYRALLPLFPWAIASLDLYEYDLIISLSHAAAKNVRVAPGSTHLCYCFTPMRYIWDQAPSYLGKALVPAWPLIKALRVWDRHTRSDSGRFTRRVDGFACISRFVAARIRCFYGRKARVIHPPVNTSWIPAATPGTRGVAFLSAGAQVPYKRTELAIRVFNRLQLPLWVVGAGADDSKFGSLAGPTVKLLGRLDDAELAQCYRRCRALVFPGIEDFGLIPVECLAAGRPVIGLQSGGLLDTLQALGQGPGAVALQQACGVWIPRQRKAEAGARLAAEESALAQAIETFCQFEPQFLVSTCVAQAQKFRPEVFYQSWRAWLQSEFPKVDPGSTVVAGSTASTESKQSARRQALAV